MGQRTAPEKLAAIGVDVAYQSVVVELAVGDVGGAIGASRIARKSRTKASITGSEIGCSDSGDSSSG